MRKVIAGMKVSIDGRMEGPDGVADWVEAWSEDYGLTSEIDACLLGGGMYPGYEQYWTGLREQPTTPAWITGEPPTAAERDWVDVIGKTPHYVLSTTLSTTSWSNTTFLRSMSEVAALKEQPCAGIYAIGGARLVVGLLDAGLLDELRLICYPLIAGEGTSLFATAAARHRLDLRSVEQLPGGKVGLVYAVGA